jgi:small-conductance mechanosensitive channel
MEEAPAKRPRFQNLERLIAGMTLAIGLAAALAVGLLHDWVWAAGVAIGSVLAWLNFRWLKQGVAALAATAVAQSNGNISNGDREGTASAVPEAAENPRASAPEVSDVNQDLPESARSQKISHVPLGSYFMAMFRYALIAIAVYVIFKYLKVPILSMIAGLFALGAAALVACLYEISRPVD